MIEVPPFWLNKFAGWLSPRRIRVQAMILAVCLWTVVIVDFSTPGLLDRAGNIKFQDFLQFYIAGKLVNEHRIDELYNSQTEIRETEKILGHPAPIHLPTVYGPQVAASFSPFSHLPFLYAAIVVTMIGTVSFLWGCWWFLDFCPKLKSIRRMILLVVLAFPPFFHFVVRGQLSFVIFLSFIFAYYALRTGNEWVAGFSLSLAVFKPQFLLGAVIVLIVGRSWRVITATIAGAAIQFAAVWVKFGDAVMRAYLNVLWHLPGMNQYLEPGVAPSQMHSLHSFWTLILPWSKVAIAFYILSSIAVLYLTTQAWQSSGPLSLRFSALLLATVLVNPHLYVYDLLALSPVFFLTTDWILQHPEHPWSSGIKSLLYLSFLLPLFGPLAIWTHVQLSVIAFVVLLILLGTILTSDSSGNLTELNS